MADLHGAKAEMKMRWIPICTLAALIGFVATQTASADEVRGTWAGPYVGLSLGALHSTGRAERAGFSGSLLTLDVQNGLFPGSIDGSDRSLTVGVGFGINVQRGAFVGGIEADISALDHEQKLNFSRVDPNPSPPFTGIDTNTGYRTKFGTMATLRARGGYAVGRNLYFATAGLAAGRVRNAFSLDLPDLGYASPSWTDGSTRIGYAIGLGAERRVTDRLGLRFEILHIDLSDSRIKATDPATFPGERIDYKFKNKATIARIGVHIKF